MNLSLQLFIIGLVLGFIIYRAIKKGREFNIYGDWFRMIMKDVFKGRK